MRLTNDCGKQDPFIHIWKKSGNMQKSVGLQFFRATIGI